MATPAVLRGNTRNLVTRRQVEGTVKTLPPPQGRLSPGPQGPRSPALCLDPAPTCMLCGRGAEPTLVCWCLCPHGCPAPLGAGMPPGCSLYLYDYLFCIHSLNTKETPSGGVLFLREPIFPSVCRCDHIRLCLSTWVTTCLSSLGSAPPDACWFLWSFYHSSPATPEMPTA